jgi:GPH family glycoside/pentoside/hexuronide:cation symporter
MQNEILLFPARLLGAMFADKVDCSERQSGIRLTGFIYSAASNGIKIGQGPGSVRVTAILAMGHYVPNINQTASSLAAIRFNYGWPS